MNTVISFTLAQLWGTVVSICAGFATIAGAVVLIMKGITKLKSPNKVQDERLTELYEKTKKHDGILNDNNRRLKNLENGRRIEQRALLALLKHGIDNNNVEAMRASTKEIQDYLISK